MRVAIAGAGNVGRSIANELLEHGHDVLLIEKKPQMVRSHLVPGANWVLADACELSSLEEARLERCDVVVAATGDDKANLVVSLLAKTEFAVDRVVARVNRAENEWLFDQQWGVDIAVSKPRLLAALVEEAVSIGDLVRLLSFRQGQANLVELTLSEDTPAAGRRVAEIELPRNAVLCAIVRGPRVFAPARDDALEPGDELVFVASAEVEDDLQRIFGSQRESNSE